MKHMIKYVISLLSVFLFAQGAWADPTVTIIKLLDGESGLDASPGEVEYDITSGICNLTVTPAEGNYVTIENITVYTVVAGDVAQGRKNAPNMDVTPIAIEQTGSNTDPSGVTTYRFTYPTDGSDAEVTVDFQSCTWLTDDMVTLSATSFVYNGETQKPTVTVKDGTKTLTEGVDYTVDDNDVGSNVSNSYRVIVNGKGIYVGEVEKDFVIRPAAPVITPASGTYNDPVNFQITTTGDNDDTRTYYKIDDDEPMLYEGPDHIYKSGKVSAWVEYWEDGQALDGMTSDTTTVEYAIRPGAPDIFLNDGLLGFEYDADISTVMYKIDDAEYVAYDPDEAPEIMPGQVVLAYSATADHLYSDTITAKYFGFVSQNVNAVYGEQEVLSMPAVVPAIDDGDGLTISYFSSDESVVQAEESELNIVGAGITTISASLMTSDTPFIILNDDYMLDDVTATIVPAAPSFDKEAGTYNEAITVVITGMEDENLTTYYQIDNNPVAGNEVTIEHSATLKAWVKVDGDYQLTSDTTTAEYIIRQDPQLLFYDPTIQANIEPMTAATAQMGKGFTSAEPKLHNPTKRVVTFDSSDKNVATIDEEGAVTLVSAGMTTISAVSETDSLYVEGHASYVLTVEVAEPQKPVITVQNVTDIYADKVFTVTQTDAADGDRIICNIFNNDTKVNMDSTYTEPITLSDLGQYTVTARVRRGQLISDGDTLTIYVLKEPQFSPEEGNYNRERQVKLVGLPTLPEDENDYPRAYIKAGDAEAFTRYFNGDAITVNTTTTFTAYVEDKNTEGNVLRSEDLSVTYTFPPVIDYYQVAVNGVTVTSLNKDNVLGDATKSVHYDDESKTLTLNNATIGGTTDLKPTGIQTAMPLLNVNLIGSNTISASAQAFKSTYTDAVVAFTTALESPGKLFINCATAYTDITPDYGSTMQMANNWITVKPTELGIIVADVPVTDANNDNVLGDDDATVMFDIENKMLILNNASLADNDIVSSRDALIIYLSGENAINAITSNKENAALTFTTAPNSPGTLAFTADEWHTGFAAPTYKTPLGLVDKKIMSTEVLGTITYDDKKEDPVDPITFNEDDFITKEGGGEEKPVDLANTTIGDILYTVPTDEGNGFDAGEEKEDPGIKLSVEVTNEELESAMSYTPGSTEFADKFKGMTLRIPEGTGKIIIDLQTDEDYILHVKIGSNEPVKVTQTERGKVEIPYEVTEPTYVYIYNPEQPSAARRDRGSHRDKVTSVHVKIYSVDASMSSVVTPNALSSSTSSVVDNRVTIIDLSALGISKEDLKNMAYISLSTINGKPITNLGAGLFDGMSKDDVSYVDLSETEVSDVTTNRDAGTFDGFSDNTLILLPEGNSDGGEDNVVIGDGCNSLSLGGDNTFATPKDFTAAVAALDRTFTEGQTATVFLPFALSKDQADALGNFHTFKEIKGGNAVFNEAEANGTDANMPYIFVPASGVSTFEATNVAVKGLAPDQTSVTTGQLIGTYEQIIWETDQPDIYGFAAEDEGEDVKAGQFVRVAAGASIDPFRAYLKVESAPARLNIVISGEEGTGISNLTTTSTTDERNFYDLQGRRIEGSNLKSGLYIKDGRKVVIK